MNRLLHNNHEMTVRFMFYLPHLLSDQEGETLLDTHPEADSEANKYEVVLYHHQATERAEAENN